MNSKALTFVLPATCLLACSNPGDEILDQGSDMTETHGNAVVVEYKLPSRI